MTAKNKGPVWRNQALQKPSSPDTHGADSVLALPKWPTHPCLLGIGDQALSARLNVGVHNKEAEGQACNIGIGENVSYLGPGKEQRNKGKGA